MESSFRAKLGDWLWFFGWGIASSVWCLTVAATIGATFDEPSELDNAMQFWREGSHDKLLRLGSMPLPMDLASLPAHLWERTHGESIDFNTDPSESLLFWARVPILLFWWVLLAYGRLIGRSLAGPWGGRLAVALLAVEPSLLAHACLATKDMAITACLAAFVYHYRAGRDAGWLQRVGWPALWCGLALLAKASAIVFCPICMFVVETERLVRLGGLFADSSGDPPHGRHWFGKIYARYRPFLFDAVQIGTLGSVLMFVYCGSDWQPQGDFVSWAHSLPEDSTFGNTMVWLSEHLCIFRNAGNGIARQVSHNIRGHGCYLLGRADPVSIWYYFPVALTMKLTEPLLALPILLAVIRPRSLANWACIVAGVLFVYTVQCRVQIGVRLVLPLVGIGAAGLAAAAVNAWRDLPPGPRKLILSAAIPAGLLWSATSAVMVWPHGLCYVNTLWGGTEAGYRIVSDGNYDWGQGVRELAHWHRQHPDLPLEVCYFGSDPAINTLGVRQMSFFDLIALKSPGDAERLMRGRFIAVSTTMVYGPMTGLQISEYLQTQQPVARTQTFLIYDFRRAE